jgi:hypothetical protein
MIIYGTVFLYDDYKWFSMSTNLVECIQKEMGFLPLQKIDPNIQETKERSITAKQRLAQAAIPTVLAGFFASTRTDDGCKQILTGATSENWVNLIFRDNKLNVVEKVAQYAGLSLNETALAMEDIAREAEIVIRREIGEKPTIEKLRSYMRSQRHHILVHLPAALQLGDLFHDNAMDDRTNKMEGPVSNFMHNIENRLSGGGPRQPDLLTGHEKNSKAD